ncbi:hypothetical protein DCC81_12160 [Chitinophaga parva]|uniref:Uncharacterized protein n=1 Tax=Chitinophaga parva TaxID=2169414 RepID=A0A2T7BFK2_9BACT|nr:hypothetical protein DCC81_12160 [Chitinophaga parva]
MNFGVIAPESIDDGYMEADDCEDIKTFRKKWNGLNDNIILHCYVIKTSSTGSELRIIAQSFEEIL